MSGKNSGGKPARTKTLRPASGRVKRRKTKTFLSNWIAVRVKDNQERHARKGIEREGHRVFIPWLYEEGARKEEPLFPGYIFVEGPQWQYLKTTPGVLYPIMMGESAAFMPKREMKQLMGLCDKEGIITLKHEKLIKGESVRAKTGAFQELWGVYNGVITGTKRVRVLYTILGKEFELGFDRGDVTAYGPGQDNRAKDIVVQRGGRSIRNNEGSEP